ncbi:ABC-2 transporter permease [Schinkia azotoformans]|uniref:ABC-2 transporter permease n=1 Tax=Schinkia azotoformans TaxID=1454 RepID=UPI0030C93596
MITLYHLIKKDILIQKRNLLMACILIAFFIFTLSNIGMAGLSISILAVSYTLALGVSQIEDKNKSDLMLVSLPIKKSKIVLSKYISVYVFVLYAILVNYIFSFIIKIFELPIKFEWFTVDGILGAIISVTIFTSISLPLIFKWGYTKAKLPNYIIFFLFVIGAMSVISNLDYYSTTRIFEFFGQLSNSEMIVLILIPLVLIVTISYLLSLVFYSKREF